MLLNMVLKPPQQDYWPVLRVHLHAHTCAQACACTCMYAHAWAWVHIQVHMHGCVHMHACLHAYAHIHVCACECASGCTPTCARSVCAVTMNHRACVCAHALWFMSHVQPKPSNISWKSWEAFGQGIAKQLSEAQTASNGPVQIASGSFSMLRWFCLHVCVCEHEHDSMLLGRRPKSMLGAHAHIHTHGKDPEISVWLPSASAGQSHADFWGFPKSSKHAKKLPSEPVCKRKRSKQAQMEAFWHVLSL